MKAFMLVLATAASGCYEPDVGAALGPSVDSGIDGATTDGGIPPVPGCDNSDSNPAVAVSFASDVRPLMTRSPGGCGPCHLSRAASGFDQSSYQSLRRGGLNSGTRIIISGDPCNSIFLQKIGRTPPFGTRMPYNGPPYFSAEERLIVHDWIAEGALNN